MNEQAIQEQYQHIVTLLKQQRLKEAQSQLEAFFGTAVTGHSATAWNKLRHPISTCCNTCAKESTILNVRNYIARS